MQWIDQKYIGGLAPRLSMFAQKDANVWNMRCPICGDSKKSKTKARGYILGKGGSFLYVCHNCNVSMPFGKFLEIVDPTAYQDYVRERFVEKANNFSTANIAEPVADISKFITPKFIKYTALSELQKISQLDANHPVKKYIVKRKIPNRYHAKLFFAPKFKEWTNTLIPDKFDLSKKDESRLIIPFVDKNGNLFGFQGRALGKQEPKYITIILNAKIPKVYGLESINTREHVYVVEGPIDAMFIDNALAMAGAHLDRASEQIGLKKETTTVVYDNEPRNAEIVRLMEKVIESGFNICIWPQEIRQKDINEMILAGCTTSQIKRIIDNNTYNGLTAKLQLAGWRKI